MFMVMGDLLCRMVVGHVLVVAHGHSEQHRLLGAEDAVHEEQLSQRQWVAMVLPHHAVREITELLGRQMPQLLVPRVDVVPDPVFQSISRTSAVSASSSSCTARSPFVG